MKKLISAILVLAVAGCMSLGCAKKQDKPKVPVKPPIEVPKEAPEKPAGS